MIEGAAESKITILEVLIQLVDCEPEINTALVSLAPIAGGGIAWWLNRLFLKYDLPEHLLQQDALLAQSIRMLKKDIKCSYTSDDRKKEMQKEIADTKEARRKLRLEAAQAPAR